MHYKAFAELWKKGYYVTEGVKYGSDFLAYVEDPETCHAKYMVFVAGGEKVEVSKLVTYERIAESNKKIAVLAWEKDSAVKLITVSQLHILDSK